MANVLKIENLNCQNILNGVTFSLEENSFNILIGSNGSGKTTIVNCIRNLIKYQGEIEIFNQNIKSIDNELYKKIGFFTEESIVLENCLFVELLYVLKNLDYDEQSAKKRIYDIAKKFEITEILYKNHAKLLLHEMSLISFIFAIIHEPKIIIIDNNLNLIESKAKNKIIKYLTSQKKLTKLLISNESEYFQLANQLLFLDNGKIVLSGNLNDIIEYEKTIIKCGSKLPFMIDLSNKFIAYGLLDKIELDIEKMVNKIWNKE